jgi:hypothetical protein
MAFSSAQIQVATAIHEFNGPESVKQLLLAALPHSFGTNVHQFQKEAASMLRKSLEEARAAAGEAQVATTQRVKEAQIILEALQADVESSTGAEEAAHAVLNEKASAVEVAHETVKREEAACDEASSTKVEVVAEQQKHEAAKAEIESIQTGSFRMLLDGGWEDEEVRDACIDAVCNYLSAEGADVVLMAALPKALALRPAECGGFDKMAVDEAFRLISEKVAACDAKLKEHADAFEDATAEHLGAWAIADVAREKEKAANAERDAAHAALQSASVDKKLALSKVMDQKTSLETVVKEATLMESKVQTLDLALTSLAQLEAGEPVDKENKENNKDDAMVVDEEAKETPMAVDQIPVAVTA